MFVSDIQRSWVTEEIPYSKVSQSENKTKTGTDDIR